MDRSNLHHDALEFANGRVVLITSLVIGQRAQVLQMPASRVESPAAERAAGRYWPEPEIRIWPRSILPLGDRHPCGQQPFAFRPAKSRPIKFGYPDILGADLPRC
jgi:hypothetical protein